MIFIELIVKVRIYEVNVPLFKKNFTKIGSISYLNNIQKNNWGMELKTLVKIRFSGRTFVKIRSWPMAEWGNRLA